VLLLDEPTRGMDHETKELLVANLWRRTAAGACVVLASHDVELAARAADRVVLLAEGEVIADGPARSVLTESMAFSTQANKLFGGDVLTVEDALRVARNGL
jgi:energy-coupling factor transport system ATP-binding protein